MDAPFWLKLEMEMLTLLFHSLWILQCNTVSADSIIHIGKTPTGASFLGGFAVQGFGFGERHAGGCMQGRLKTQNVSGKAGYWWV